MFAMQTFPRTNVASLARIYRLYGAGQHHSTEALLQCTDHRVSLERRACFGLTFRGGRGRDTRRRRRSLLGKGDLEPQRRIEMARERLRELVLGTARARGCAAGIESQSHRRSVPPAPDAVGGQLAR